MGASVLGVNWTVTRLTLSDSKSVNNGEAIEFHKGHGVSRRQADRALREQTTGETHTHIGIQA